MKAKKLLAALLSAAMLITSAAVPVLAEEIDENTVVETTTVETQPEEAAEETGDALVENVEPEEESLEEQINAEESGDDQAPLAASGAYSIRSIISDGVAKIATLVDSQSVTEAAQGTAVTVKVTPKGKSTVKKVKVEEDNGAFYPQSYTVTKSEDDENTYTFTMPYANVKVSAEMNTWYGSETENQGTNTCKFELSDGKTYYYNRILDAINDTQFEGATGTITMLKDETINTEYYEDSQGNRIDSYGPYIRNNVKITSIDPEHPCTINVGKRTSPLIYMTSSNPATVTLENIIIDGGGDSNKHNTSIISIADDTTLNLNKGAVIQNSYVSTSFTYGAAMVIGGGIVNMNEGSKITGCTLETYSMGLGNNPFGAVYISSGGTFTMYGGEISNNRTSQMKAMGGLPLTTGGGGAIFMNGGTFKMEDGIITNNSAYYGGAIFMNRDATFEMTGGKITGNTADAGVGGIIVAPTRNKVKLSGNCVITGNTSDGGRRGDNLYMDGNNTGDGLFAELYAGSFTEGAKVDIFTYMWSSDEVLDNEANPIVRPLEPSQALTEDQLKFFHSEDPVIGLKLGKQGNFLATKRADADISVMDTDSMLGTEVTLNALSEHKDVIKDEEGATYQVVLQKAPDEDVEAVQDAMLQASDNHKEKAIFDVKVRKTTDSGEVSYVEDELENQMVIITLPQEPKGGLVNAYHVSGETAEPISVRKVNGRQVIFFASKFSTYAVTYDLDTPVTQEKIADKIGVVYKKIDDKQYDIYLKAIGDDDQADKMINRYMSAELEFELTPTQEDENNKISYDIEPAEYMAASRTEGDKWHFEMDGSGDPDTSGHEIKIGTITFAGYGGFTFKVKTAEGKESINVAHTAEIANNIVSDYTELDKTLLLSEDELKLSNDELAKIDGEITPSTRDLTVNVTFPNEVVGQIADYTDMQVTISGLLLDEPIKVDLGNDKNQDDPAVEYTNAATEGDLPYAKYSFTQQLTEGRYTITFSGGGYRTFSHDVLVNADKTITVWNNAMDEKKIVVSGDDPETEVTFLAGDIIEDNTINLYDLSAAVAYFGKHEDSLEDMQQYVQYDLNRDGAIDSKDIAMVLVSWGK